jgi:glycosyltransferase involved in cell wall biosynthesis
MQQVLVIGYVWPEPNSSAAGGRMMQLLEFLNTAGASVTFATTATPSDFSENLEEMGIQSAGIELNNPNFDSFLDNLQPDIVVYDRFMMEEQFGWRVSQICPSALTILDTEDLHFLRKFREIQFKYKEKGISVKNSELAKREIASIYRCDLSLIISEVELKLLTREFHVPENLLFYLPFLFDEITSYEKGLLPSFEERKNFIFLGNFKHAPNVDAVHFLKEFIWPLIYKEIPDAQMLIYGAYPSARIDQLHQPTINFYIKGRAKVATTEVKKARVSLAPLRFGAGLKGKLVEAMLCGTPNVTTKFGAEGVNGELPWSGSIKDNPEEFAIAAIDLYSSKKEWEAAQKRGFTIINSRFIQTLFYKSFSSKLSKLSKNIEKHREENFTGNMLKHHSMRSTYLLSRYIELKTEMKKTTSINEQRGGNIQ